MSLFALEKRVAQLAIQRACKLTQKVSSGEHLNSITKSDDSPVTVADFGAQAIIISALKHAFPSDLIVGEEDSEKLRSDKNLCENVWNLVNEASSDDDFSKEIGQLKSAQEMIQAIDFGNSNGGNKGRIWALDPVDGTKGFLRKEQYAICVGLMIDGKVEVGVIGCPNLSYDNEKKGALFSAATNQGAFINPLYETISAENTKKIQFNAISDPSKATFCESVESGHSSHSTQAEIASKLGITNPSVRMDSQAKYCSIARGDGDIYLRLPVSATYEEKIWDHAAGNVLISEAGGKVTDMFGNDLNFGIGRTLKENKGVIAASKSIHSQVLQAVHEVTQK